VKDKKYFSLPVEIKENKLFSFDDSLIPVDIKVMHDGLNLNETTFFDEAIEDAKETLKNKPILGYIKKGEGTNESDFSGHEIEISMNDNGMQVVYLERPLGTVPESNNYSIQTDKNGKKFVYCRGYLWKEYLNSGYEILQSNPKKSVSMEIAVDDYDVNSDGSLNVKKYRYLGITILGDNVLPAMDGAEMNVVGQFAKEDNVLYSKMEELNAKITEHFSKELKESFKGGENVTKKFEEEITEEIVEDVVKTEETIETEKIIEPEETVEEIQEETEEVAEVADKEIEEKVNEIEVEKFTKTFELSHDDVRSKLYNQLYKVEETDNTWYWIDRVFDDHFIYSNDIKIFKQGYIKTDVDVALEGERVEMFVEYLTEGELTTLNNMRGNYELTISENTELKSFKENILLQQKSNEFEEMFNKYSTLLDKSDFEDLKDSAMDMEIDALEKELSYRLVQKKFDFSKIVKKDSTKLSIKDDETNDEPYGSVSFNK